MERKLGAFECSSITLHFYNLINLFSYRKSKIEQNWKQFVPSSSNQNITITNVTSQDEFRTIIIPSPVIFFNKSSRPARLVFHSISILDPADLNLPYIAVVRLLSPSFLYVLLYINIWKFINN